MLDKCIAQARALVNISNIRRSKFKYHISIIVHSVFVFSSPKNRGELEYPPPDEKSRDYVILS